MTNDLRTRLRSSDPVVKEGGLSPSDLDRLRRHIRMVKRQPSLRPSPVVIALTGALVITVAAGIHVTRPIRQIAAIADRPLQLASEVPAGLPAKQFQFSGPGGTRLIWSFNPAFEVK